MEMIIFSHFDKVRSLYMKMKKTVLALTGWTGRENNGSQAGLVERTMVTRGIRGREKEREGREREKDRKREREREKRGK
jgi:hypothetical protein